MGQRLDRIKQLNCDTGAIDPYFQCFNLLLDLVKGEGHHVPGTLTQNVGTSPKLPDHLHQAHKPTMPQAPIGEK